MLNWLNDSPGSAVLRNAENQKPEAANPHGYATFPERRFARFQNKAAAQQQNETASTREAEARRGAVLGAEGGELPRPESLTVTRQQLQTGNHDQPEAMSTGPPWLFPLRVVRAALFRQIVPPKIG